MDTVLVNKETEARNCGKNSVPSTSSGQGWEVEESLALSFSGGNPLPIIFSFIEFSFSSQNALASQGPQLLLKFP